VFKLTDSSKMEFLDEILCQSGKEEDFYEILGCNEISNVSRIN